MKKTCTKCKKEKELSAFYRDSRTKDGLRCWCKACVRKYNQSKVGKMVKRKSAAKYRLTPKGKEVRKKYQQSEISKETQRKYDIKRRKDFPEKKKARDAATYAVKTGRLIKEPCPCGELKVEGHHEDYSKPLEVDWLCTKCHRKLERKETDES